MKTSRKSIARVGAVVGFAALALSVNPALGSATVAGYLHAWTMPNGTIKVELTEVSSPTLVGCHVDVTEFFGRYSTRGEVVVTGSPGVGTYTSPVLNWDWKYNVTATCVDADGATELAASPDTPQRGSADSAGMYLESVGSLFGS
ncbi:hypothetical protein [Rhodococcus maanshanensis]|uniref:Ig-like domain-containing protein n=1 Tax=Rhodococcus maanshanensis TaxID=183556 RepID=A0A1H7T8H3_9NOCA|nr:hypothetical protein [Rhodococcus maanshanensis]SEL80127.1 hypothetical protein SAMN05444583_1158 [Rhodococcus maanshanensis]